MMYRLKKFVLFLIQLLVVFAVIAGAAYFLKLHEGIDFVRQKQEVEKTFPQTSGAVEKNYSWKYAGKEYELSQNLYESSYAFYQASPKVYSYEGNLPENWQEQYYGMFLVAHKEDDPVVTLANSLRELGKKSGLSSDQIVELAIAFVQSIPYDDAKAAQIDKEGGDATVRYPYEVLYENSGVCSEKSLLAAAILRQLGYGSALFAYEQDNHMAVGVQCPKEYSTYASGYCYAETTAVGHKIGIVPEIDPTKSKAVEIRELGSFEKEASANLSKELGSADIYQKNQAAEYRGIIATIKTNQEIAQLQKDITALKKKLLAMQAEVSKLENQLEDMKDDMEKYKRKEDFESYNDLVKPYNKKAEEYRKAVSQYNSLVDQYNKKIARYNSLIKE